MSIAKWYSFTEGLKYDGDEPSFFNVKNKEWAILLCDNYKIINAMPPLYDSNNDPYNYDYHTLTIIL